jgi:Na+/proline symporter
MLEFKEFGVFSQQTSTFFYFFLGFGIAAIVGITISFLIGAYTYFLIRGSVENFFVAGRSLPFLVTAITLAAQSIDSNALLGNADLAYRFSFWDGKLLF